jgi:hypothetical protein
MKSMGSLSSLSGSDGWGGRSEAPDAVGGATIASRASRLPRDADKNEGLKNRRYKALVRNSGMVRWESKFTLLVHAPFPDQTKESIEC